VSSSSASFIGKRHPYFVEMLEEVFNLSIRDWDVLALCDYAPLTPMQCNQSRRESAKGLEERGYLTFVYRKQRWELTVLGHCTLAAATLYVHRYEPASQGKGDVLEFPTLRDKGKFA
jgi:hypothetical protein